MFTKRLLCSALMLSCLGTAAAAPPALSAGAQEFTLRADLKCDGVNRPFGWPPVGLFLRGTVDATTEPGQAVEVSNLTAYLSDAQQDTYSGGGPFVPETYYPHLLSMTLGVVGGAPASLEVPGLPRALGPVTNYESGGYARYSVAIPSLELPAVVTSGPAPVAIRLGSIVVASLGSTVAGPAGAGTLCRPAYSTTLAVVPSTGPAPAAPTLEPAADLSGPFAGGNVVTLRGTNLTYVRGVETDSGFLPVGNGVVVKDDQSIDVTMPPYPGGRETGTLTAISETGRSNEVPYTYGYATLPRPTVTKVTPARIPKSAGTVELVIEGTGFDRAVGVKFGYAEGEVLETNAAGTRLRARFTRGWRDAWGWMPYSASVEVRSLSGCEGSRCRSEDTPQDDVRLFAPTVDLPGFPTQPAGLTATRSGASVTLTWTDAAASSGVTYDVYRNFGWNYDKVATVPGSVKTATVQINASDQADGVVFYVRAKNAQGDESLVSEPVFVPGDVLDPEPPVAPEISRAERMADPTVVELQWELPLETPRDDIAGYQVLLDGTKIETVYTSMPYRTFSVDSLVPSRASRFEVRAFDVAGNFGPSAEVTIPGVACEACEPDVVIDYAVKGAATIKTLVKGSAPLTGTLSGGTFLGGTGAFEADLALAPSVARLQAYGFLPVVASVAVVPTSKVSGALTGDVLTAAVKARIKVPKVSILGVQLGGGATCQTRSVSNIALASTGPFAAKTGGNLAGTFAMSALTGCGALTGIVSPLTAGSNNAIALALSPR